MRNRFPAEGALGDSLLLPFSNFKFKKGNIPVMDEPKRKTSVTINGTEYQLSPLLCKHLKQITQLLNDTSTRIAVYADLERWMPFVVASIKMKHPEVPDEITGEMTMQQFTDCWNDVLALSGIVLVPKGGEKPKEEAKAADATS